MSKWQKQAREEEAQHVAFGETLIGKLSDEQARKLRRVVEAGVGSVGYWLWLADEYAKWNLGEETKLGYDHWFSLAVYSITEHVDDNDRHYSRDLADEEIARGARRVMGNLVRCTTQPHTTQAELDAAAEETVEEMARPFRR